VLSSARFSSKGLSLLVSFDSDSDMAGLEEGEKFDCSSLLWFEGVEDLPSKACKFTSAFELTASLDATASVLPGQNLTLLEDRLKTACTAAMLDCGSNEFANASSVVIEEPSTPLYPASVLSGPSSVGYCGEVSLDASSSSGGGGRALGFAWLASSSTGGNTTLLAAFLSDQNGSALSLSAASYLEAGHTYSFQVQTSNFLGRDSIASLDVVVENNIVSEVSFLGGSSRSSLGSKAVSINAYSNLPACAGDKSIPGWTWSDTRKNSIVSLSTSRDPSALYFPKNTFKGGNTYTFTAVPLHSSGITGSASFKLTIEKGALLAVLEGGSSFTAPPSFVLNASQSYDSDDPTDSSSLRFSFDCVEQSPNFGTDCSSTLTTSSTQNFASVNASAFGNGSVLEYTLTVSDVSDGRTASTTAEVTVIEPVEASVTVSSSSGSLELGVLRVNKDRKIVLDGKIVYATDVSAFWEMLEGYLDSKSFEDVVSTSLNKTFSGDSAQNSSLSLGRRLQVESTASSASFPLAILPDSLSQCLSYKFQLTGAVSETERVRLSHRGRQQPAFLWLSGGLSLARHRVQHKLCVPGQELGRRGG